MGNGSQASRLGQEPPSSAGRRTSIPRILLACCAFFLLVAGIPEALVAMLLLVEAETISGRVFAVSFLTLYAATVGLYRWLRKSGKRAATAAVISLALAVAGFAFCYCLSPSGVAPTGSKLHSAYSDHHQITRWSPVNLVPEIDQVMLGVALSPYIDRIMTREKATRLKALFLTAYREMERDPEFVAAGSAMNRAYWDLFGQTCSGQHQYVYVPAHPAGQKLPAIVFLHGSGGNFKAFLWTWKQLADAHQIAVIAPTFGFGNWDRPGGMEAVDAAYRACLQQPDVDPKRIVLAGLSNGGLGVSRAASLNPARYQGLIYLSAVLEPEVVNSAAFRQGCAGKPVLVIHGSEDERIPRLFIDPVLADLPLKIQTKFYPHEDHFLILSRRSEVMADIARWMQEQLTF
jgi:pimeloyl-ACP methyl ester carboxylesterase